MQVKIEANGVKVMMLSGRFDATVSDLFKTRMDELTGDHINVVIDMGEVSYIDSSGLGSIVATLRKIREQKGDLKVACLTDPVRSVFQVTRCHRLVEIYDDTEAAVASFDGVE